MAKQMQLDATPRTVVGKATKQLRREGQIPANIYGHKEESIAVQIDVNAFERIRREHGLKSVISLQLPDTAVQTVLIRHIQQHPISGKLVHVDFVRVSMSERIEARVPLHFAGEAPGVKVQGGVLLHLLDALSVECRASDIVESLDIDVTSLAEIGDTLHARDVKLPDGYTLLTDAEEPIVKVDAPRVEAAPAEVAPAATTVAPATGTGA